MREQTSLFPTSLKIVTLAAGLGAVAGSLRHTDRENLDPAYCTDLVGFTAEPLVCGEKAFFHPSVYETKEGRQGGAVGAAAGAFLLAIASIMDRKNRDKDNSDRPTHI